MRIDHLQITNFKSFEANDFTFHPQFNLIIGDNGTGKTSLLDALAIAAGSWLLGIGGGESRHIRHDEIMLQCFTFESSECRWEQRLPCRVDAKGVVQGHAIRWGREIEKEGGRTKYADANAIKALAVAAEADVREGESVALPLVSYYGTGRLWQEPRDHFRIEDPTEIAEKVNQSRLTGYRNSIDPRLSVTELTRWIARQSWIAFQKKQPQPILDIVLDAMKQCVEGADAIYFDTERSETVITINGRSQPFSNLSDGQRSMLAMIGDIAQKAVRLNPVYGDAVLQRTQGIVMIDELDLHLHPRWQRSIIENLRNVFPNIQFFCTTHSPFLVQSLRSGEELLMLQGEPTASLGDMPIEEIAVGIMGVDDTRSSKRYDIMKEHAKHYLELLEEAAMAPEEKLEAFKAQLADTIAPFADNPAYQAFLEMKRAAKLGE